MGRSSNSSHYQLSANRLISRIHVKARYVPATTPLEPNRVEIQCTGWNGLKLHCQGKTWELRKNDTFTSETEDAEMMLDVQDARVMVQWPKRERHESIANLSDSSWDESPRARHHHNADLLLSSPLRRQTRVQSPESPTPGLKSASASSSSLNAILANGGASEQVQIYEDPEEDEQELPDAIPLPEDGYSFARTEATNSFSSDLSEPEDENDPDEENDPIVHSFGPFGANLSNRMAAFATDSPREPSRILSDHSTLMPQVAEEEEMPPLPEHLDVAAITNHVVNQLAYSRLSSNPLSGILNNLPAEEKKGLQKRDLRRIIEGTDCIGIIPRHGKDAAGKALESEYYYVPERDTDNSRRLAVTDGLRKPSLRACRKQHKVTHGNPGRMTAMLMRPSNTFGSGRTSYLRCTIGFRFFGSLRSYTPFFFTSLLIILALSQYPRSLVIVSCVCIAKGVLCCSGGIRVSIVLCRSNRDLLDCLCICGSSWLGACRAGEYGLMGHGTEKVEGRESCNVYKDAE